MMLYLYFFMYDTHAQKLSTYIHESGPKKVAVKIFSRGSREKKRFANQLMAGAALCP